MEPVTYSWIGLSAVAPVIFLICAWVLGVYHSYRKLWRSVDLFLLAIFVQELLTALQAFIYALLSLMQPSSGVLCSIFIWSLSATRALQAATVCSLLVDRALTSQWPYKYRFSVRRHQIRYHLVVLATMAALVGVAAILARPSEISSNFKECRFLPHSLHVRLALFLLSLYGILLVISAVSTCVVQTTRSCRSGSSGPSDLQDMTPITHGTTGSSTTTTSSGRTQIGRPQRPLASSSSIASSTSSGRLGGGLLHSSSSTTDLVPPTLRSYHRRLAKLPPSRKTLKPTTDDFRWGISIAVAALCFFVNHIPYMCLLIMGTFFPSLLPQWPMENLSLWLSLIEGLLLPVLVGMCDSTFGEAAVHSCNRERMVPTKYSENEGHLFRICTKEDVKSFPLTNGSLFSSLHTMNADSPFHQLPSSACNKGFPLGTRTAMLSTHDLHGLGGGGLHRPPVGPHRLYNNFGHLFYNPDGPSSMGYIERSRNDDPIYSDPLNKASSTDSSLKFTEDDHIYATLSDESGSLSSLSDGCLGDHQRCSSATTVANDDFEYHGPRSTIKNTLGDSRAREADVSSTYMQTSGALACRPPAKLPPEALEHCGAYLNDSLDSTTDSSAGCSFRSSYCSDHSDVITLDSSKNTDREKILKTNTSPMHGIVNGTFENDVLSESIYKYFDERTKPGRQKLNTSFQEQERKYADPEGTNTLSKKHRSSSLSMNDLDRVEFLNSEQEEEMMFILPVKSESMLSLYRLYLAEEDEDTGATNLRYSVEVSRSESNLAELLDNGNNSPETRNKPDNAVIHEIYQKKKVPTLAGSRIRRQHKIQRAKGVHQKSKPVVPTHRKVSIGTQSEPEHFWSPDTERSSENEGLQMAVMDKLRKQNGIISIKDPSVLSVEELFSVLGRASAPQKKLVTVSRKESDNSTLDSNYSKYDITRNHPITEYKKIFVSEYI